MVFLLSVFAQPAGIERRDTKSPFVRRQQKSWAAEGKVSDSERWHVLAGRFLMRRTWLGCFGKDPTYSLGTVN